MKKHKSHGTFQQFVDIIHFKEGGYASDPDDYKEEDFQPLIDYDGWMYVTTGDDVPCLVIYGPDGFGISLKPVLALYWLQIIQEHYQSCKESAKT